MFPLCVPIRRIRNGATARQVLLSGMVASTLILPAAAQEPAGEKPVPIRLQLNKTETAGEACRITLLVDNSRSGGLKTYKVDLFAFDTDGIAQRRVAVELGPLPPNKTTVKIFDFPGIACGKIGRILLNDVLACDGGDAAREACLNRTETESKAATPFDR